MAPFSEQIPMEELFEQYASATAIAEATAFRTVSPGEYNLHVTKMEPRRYTESDRGPARDVVRCTVAVTDDEGKRKGNVFISASWQERRTAKGFLDGSTKLWGQMVKATYPDKNATDIATINVAQAMNDIPEIPMRGYISESFLVPNGAGQSVWLSPDNPDQLTDFRSHGYKAQNFVRNVTRAK